MRNKWPCATALFLLLTFRLVDDSTFAWAGDSESSGAIVAAIEFDCNAPIDEGALRALLPIHVGDPITPEATERTRWLLEQTGIFTNIVIDTRTDNDAVTLVIHLVRMPVVNRIRFRGNDALSNDQLFRAIRLRENMPLTDEVLNQAVERLRRRYGEDGFDAAEVTGEVETLAPGEVDVRFNIEEGVPLRISQIVFDGDTPVADADVRATLRLRAGDRYTRAGERAAVRAIIQLYRDRGYYQIAVDPVWQPYGLNSGILRFMIEPGPLFHLEFVGNDEFSDRALLNLIDLPRRSLITDATWRELARRARHAYQERGFYFARVTVHVEQTIEGGLKTVRFDISEGESYRVSRVNFEGNKVLSAGLLRGQMATRPPSWIPWNRGVLLDDVFDEDLRRLWFFYRRYGFEGAEIVDARTAFDAENGTVAVTVFIEEGPQTVVRRIEPVGVEPIAEHLPTLQTRVGEPLDSDAVAADREALITAFRRRGYTGADVAAETDSTRLGPEFAATVRFVAQPGVQQRVGSIIVQNNLDTRWRVIVRELPFQEGEPLDPDALLQGQQNLFRLGLFRSVTVGPLEQQGEDVERDIAVRVAERSPGHLQWGLGYNTRDGLTSFGEIGYSNLQGLARRVNLRGEFSLDPSTWTPNDYIGNLGYQAPRIFDSPYTFRNNLIAQRSTRSVDQFSIERFAIVPAVERFVAANLLGRLEFQAEQAQVFNVADDVLAFNPQDDGALTTISLAGFAIYDRRDDPFIPTKGMFDSLSLRVAPHALGSTVPFVLATAQHAQYVPIGQYLTFLYSLRAGWAQSLNSDEQVPIRYRFFIGGRTTVRGFAENSIGPTGNQGNPTGGDISLNVNSELRFPLIFGFLGAVFVDGGTVYLQNCPSSTVEGCAITFENFRRSAGLGLLYITPVGPISLDYGFKLDRRAGESIGELHFSIGAMF